jgi:hypothetical protein
MIKPGRSFAVQGFIYVAQIIPPGHLRKPHADQPATEVSRVNVVAFGQTRERLAFDQIEGLREDVSIGVPRGRPLTEPSPLLNV